MRPYPFELYDKLTGFGESAMKTARLLSFAFLCALLLQAGDVPRDAPDLKLKTTTGRTVSLAALKGKVVAVMWLSTDCSHCRQTSEMIGPIYEELAPKGLEILGLAVNPNSPGNIDAFVRNHGVKFPIGVSNRSDWMRFADLSVMARAYVPYMMIVDRKGVIRHEHPGRDRVFWADQEANMRKEFSDLLAESSGASD